MISRLSNVSMQNVVMVGLGLAMLAEPMLATTVGAAGNSFGSTLNNIWGVVQGASYPIAGIGLTVGLGSKYAEHHGFKEISHGVLNGGVLGGAVIGAGGIIAAVTPGVSGALI